MEIINGLLDTIADYMRDDHDYCIAISGAKRLGKSTLAQHIADGLSQRLRGNQWLCYQWKSEDEDAASIEAMRQELGITETGIYPSSLRYAITHAKKHDTIIGDEAVSFMSALKWNSPDCVEFSTLFDMYGYLDLCFILLMPSFRSFSKGFRVDRINAHLWLPKRGRVWLYPTQRNKDGVWTADQPTFKDVFDQLPAEREKRYRLIKEHALKKQLQELPIKEKRDKRGLLMPINENLKAEFPKLTQENRARILNIPNTTLSTWETKYGGGA